MKEHQSSKKESLFSSRFFSWEGHQIRKCEAIKAFDFLFVSRFVIFNFTWDVFCLFQSDDDRSESDTEEPSPEALARYLAMRRHTVGVGDSRHEAPEDVRVKLAHHQPIIALPQPNMFSPISILPHTNLPQNLPLVQNEPPQNYCIKDPHLLRPPQFMGPGRWRHTHGLRSSV